MENEINKSNEDKISNHNSDLESEQEIDINSKQNTITSKLKIESELNISRNVEFLPDTTEKCDLSFKIIIIGDSSVGKSCLANKVAKNIFDNKYNATLGFDYFSIFLKMDNKVIKLQIWDTCGQEIYRSLITNFYRNSSL